MEKCNTLPQVLDRLLCFVEATLNSSIHARMRAAGHFVVAVTVLGNCIGFISNCVTPWRRRVETVDYQRENAPVINLSALRQV